MSSATLADDPGWQICRQRPRVPGSATTEVPAGRMEDHVLRKLGAPLAALPVLVLVYVALVGRRGMVRLGTGFAAAAVIALVVIASLPPAPSVAVPASAVPQAVDARVLDAVTTGHGLKQPITIAFDAPMDPSSVAAAFRLQPDTAVTFGWDAGGRVLTVAPLRSWEAHTLYAVTVAESARAADGGNLAQPLRTVILTARAGHGAIAATRVAGSRVRSDSAFRITLDRPASIAVVRAALRSEPEIRGEVSAGAASGEFLFTPAAPLAAGVQYRISLDGLMGADGVAFEDPSPLVIRSVAAPGVVRFRPRTGAADVERTSAISVRFTEPMNRARTAAAFHVSAGGTAVKGAISWAEQGTVLVFVPAAALPYSATVRMRVDASAVSRAGASLAAASTGSFKVAAKPAPKPKAAPATQSKPKSKPKSKPIGHSGGGGAVSGSWSGVETYYLRLMNCTRTGGWVTATGSCSSPGGRDVAALALNSGISAQVSRPYAKLLATRNLCDHFVGGNPGDRLRSAGYRSYRWGENLGCRSGNPYSAVLGSHRYFQSEKPYNGGHYRNLMDARFRQVGIGVWVAGGRVRLVVDFYTP